MFELPGIMLQNDGAVLVELLNRLREGKQSEQDLISLKSCIISYEDF